MLKYREGYRFNVAEDWVGRSMVRQPEDIHTRYASLLKDGTLIVREAYAWDGMTKWRDTSKTMQASLKHDVEYQLIRLGLLDPKWKPIIDQDLFMTMREDGATLIESQVVLYGVTRFADQAIRPSAERPVLVAP